MGTLLRRLRHAFVLLLLVIWDLVAASVRVSIDVVTPRHSMRSAVMALPLDLESDALITLFAGIITLTPGTLTLDISEDRGHLFLHVMHIPGDDLEAERRRLKQRLEKRIALAFS